MRRMPLVVGLILVPLAAPALQPPGAEPPEPPPLHSERTPFSELRVEEVEAIVPLRKGDMIFRHPDGSPMVASRYTFRKLVQNDILYGSQFAKHERHILDDFQMFVPGVNSWDAVAIAGAIHAYDIRQEPLAYYHRTGPVGAVFSELWRRKNGADAKAPVGVLGLQIGAQACYCRPGQKITFYETDPALVKLTAGSDKFFNHVADARKRGVQVDIRIGDRRHKLAEDKDRKFALLFVDQSETFPVPKDLLTVEAVRLFLDRLTDDGIVAIHVSSKYLRLEPVVARIAAELKLAARVWNDNAEGKAGKTASSWAVLARKPEHLGELFTPLGDLPFAREPDKDGDHLLRVGLVSTPTGQFYRHLLEMPIVASVREDYTRELEAKSEKGGTKYAELNGAADARAAWLAWIDAKLKAATDPGERERLVVYRVVFDKYGPAVDLLDAMTALHGHGFRRLEVYAGMPLWTDAHADATAVMWDRRVQRIRNFFGLPTPLDR